MEGRQARQLGGNEAGLHLAMTGSTVSTFGTIWTWAFC